jgi:hypothetical protein
MFGAARALACILFGCIAVPRFADVNGQPSVRIASVEEVRSFCATDRVKLVFKADNVGLCLVDYTGVQEGSPEVRVLQGTADAILPVLSPDGEWAAWATGPNSEFVNTPSTSWMRRVSGDGSDIKVADNAYVPRFVKERGDPAIVFGTCGKHDDADKLTLDGCGQTMKRAWNGASWDESTLWTYGSFLGGLSRDGRYGAHAEQARHCFMVELQGEAGSRATLHNLPATTPAGKDTIVTSQVCNSSVSSSTHFTNAMLYLDFGYREASVPTIFGTWDFHQRMFISRFSGEIVKSYPLPEDIPTTEVSPESNGEITGLEWNYPEWSNHPYYAAVAVKTTRLWYDQSAMPPYVRKPRNEFLCLINLTSGEYLKLVSSNDTSRDASSSLHWPFAWVEEAAGFEEDQSWLNPGNAAVGETMYRPAAAVNTWIRNGRIAGSENLESVKVFSLSGRCVFSADNLEPNQSVALPTRTMRGLHVVQLRFAEKRSRPVSVLVSPTSQGR